MQMLLIQPPANSLVEVPWEVDCYDDLLENGYMNQGHCVPGLITKESWLVNSPTVITGAVSSYAEGMMELVVKNRRMSLDGFKDGIAVMSCADIGKAAWIQIPGRDWDGPFLIVDCSHRNDMYVNVMINRLVAEVGFKTAQRWGGRAWVEGKVSIGRRGGGNSISYAAWWWEHAFSFVWKPILNEPVFREHPDHPLDDRTPETDGSQEIECPTPMSLMLHSGFGVDRMESLAQEIVQRDLKTATYHDVLSGIVRGRCPDSNTIIVSLDDFRTDRVRQDIKDMVRTFTDMDLVLVLGVIVQGNQSLDIWQYLRGINGLGVEIASHTISHTNLPELDRDTISKEVIGSYQIICEHLGKCPVSLILPYGNRDRNGIILSAAQDYSFVIGIAGGTSFTSSLPAYLGRIGPYNKRQDVTIKRLEITFGNEPTPHPWYSQKMLKWAEILQ